MLRRPPNATRAHPLFPCAAPVRSGVLEYYADDVVVVDPVASAHLLEQGDDPLVDVRRFVDVDGCGAAKGSEGCRHGGRGYPRRVRATVARSSDLTSSWVSSRHDPGGSFRSASGPIRVRPKSGREECRERVCQYG